MSSAKPPPGGRGLAHGWRLCLLLLGALMCSGAHARTVEGFRFDESLQVGTDTLVLNGVGVRGVSVIKGYVLGLYVPARSRDPERLIAAPGPKLLDVRMLLPTDVATIEQALLNGLSRNSSPAELAALAPALEAFRVQMHAGVPLRPGDTIQIGYRPTQGTTLRVNGRSLGDPIEGEAFYRALLKIFIGEHVQDTRLKAALLGTPASP